MVLSHADSATAGPASSPAPPALALQQGGMEARPAQQQAAVSSPTHPGSSLTSWFHTVDTEQASGGLHILALLLLHANPSQQGLGSQAQV